MSALVRSARYSGPLFVGFALIAPACATAEDPGVPNYQPSAGGSTAGSGTTPTAGTGTTPPIGGTGTTPPIGGTGTTPTGGKPSTGGTGTTPGAGGTGTTPTAGTAATPTAGTSSSSTCAQYTGTQAKDSTIFMAGFGTAKMGMWSGYGYTYKYGTATIAPGMGNGCFVGAKFCANGSVPASDDAGAGLGWNISQMMNSMTMSKVAITTAVKISFAGVTAGMRAQLSASSTVSYCYPFTAADITAGSATIPLASFKTECWGTAGKAYDGVVPIEAIQVVVPGAAAAAVPSFDFCITDIEPG